jgi:hypothetical protein
MPITVGGKALGFRVGKNFKKKSNSTSSAQNHADSGTRVAFPI